MPKYLFKSQLNVEGVKGTLADGGTGRRDAVKKAVESVGGNLESFYYAFGDTDTYVIVELPSDAHAAAVADAVGALLITTPLFQTNLLPFFTQVNFYI